MGPFTLVYPHSVRWSCLMGVAFLFASIMMAGCSGSSSSPPPSDATAPTAPLATPGNIGSNNQTPGTEPTPPLSAPLTLQDLSSPYVTATTPKLGIKSVEPDAIIAAQISKPLAAKTANDQTVKVLNSSGNVVAGTVGTDTLGLSVQFTPSAPLINGELYTVTLGTGITDAAGNPLAQPYSWSFEVTPPPEPPLAPPQDLKPPYVIGTSPKLGDVAPSLDAAISITFNEPLSGKTASAQNVHVTDNAKTEVAGIVALNNDGTTLSFTPSMKLKDSEMYAVTIDTAITDIAGNAMNYPYTFNFKTPGMEVIAVAAGGSSFLVLKKIGTEDGVSYGNVWGWGQNHFGQLGDGTQIDRAKPVRTLISDVIAVSQGIAFSMALKKDGTVWTWGDNIFGQLGDGTTTTRVKPIQVSGLTGVKAISAGGYSGYALKTDGTLWGWGFNSAGQLGIGTITEQQNSPVQVQGLTGTVKSVVGGLTSAAAIVQSDPDNPASTGIWAWGNNYAMQLGDGTKINQSLPVQAKVGNEVLADVAMVAFGEGTMAAVTGSGDLYTWGANRYGQIGNPILCIGAQSCISSTAHLAMDKVQSVFMGTASHSILAVKQDGTLWGWGDSSLGQLATMVDGNIQKTPLQLGTISNMAAIAGNMRSTIFLQNGGSVATSGYRVNGQLGDGSADYVSYRPYYLSNVPASVSSSGMLSPTGWAGKDNMVIAAKDGSVWAWGSNQYCEMGISAKSGQTQPLLAPVQVAPAVLKNVVEVSRGAFHTLARDTDDNVWAWGDNSYAQLGNNLTSTTPSCTPAKVLDASGTGTLGNVTAISAGFLTSFAVQKDPATGKTTVVAWGYNGRGNLGLGATSGPKLLPVVVSALPDNTKKLSSGSPHMLALTETGDIYGWGPNANYQTGVSTSKNDVYTPTKITTASDGPLGAVTDICTGAFTSLALRATGTVVAWGLNVYTEALGIVSTDYMISQPTPVANVTNAIKIACSGSRTNLALTSDGHLWAWGSNTIGNMGVGNTVVYSQPQQVPGPGGTGLFSDVQDISYAVAVQKNGKVWQFGYIPDGNPESVAHLVNVVWP